MTDIISFERVSKAFPGTRRWPVVDALEEVDLNVQRGSIVGVIGYSGAGKSTLVRLINGLEKPTGGAVNVLGVDVGGASETEQLGTLTYRLHAGADAVAAVVGEWSARTKVTLPAVTAEVAASGSSTSASSESEGVV